MPVPEAVAAGTVYGGRYVPLCAVCRCHAGATRFSERGGQPPYVEAWAGEGAQAVLKGYGC